MITLLLTTEFGKKNPFLSILIGTIVDFGLVYMMVNSIMGKI